MSNPFLKPAGGNYLKFVKDQVASLEVNESKKLSFGDKEITDLRMSLTVIAKRLGWEIKTKKDDGGDLWVLRTK